MFSEFQYHTLLLLCPLTSMEVLPVVGTWKTVLVVCLISVLFSSFSAELKLCLSTQYVHIKKHAVLPSPLPPGAAISTVLVGKTKLVFLLNVSFPSCLPPFVPLPFLFSHLEYRCEAWSRSSHLVTMGINALC